MSIKNSNENTRDAITLVLGGSGKTGRRVAERIAARNVPVRAASRTATPSFDWNDRSTWDAVLDGVVAVYVTYAPDLAIPGAAEWTIVRSSWFSQNFSEGEFLGMVLDGRNAYLCDGVQRALGREPTDFADFARNIAASGRWDVTAAADEAAA